jgi:hypothetical protein
MPEHLTPEERETLASGGTVVRCVGALVYHFAIGSSGGVTLKAFTLGANSALHITAAAVPVLLEVAAMAGRYAAIAARACRYCAENWLIIETPPGEDEPVVGKALGMVSVACGRGVGYHLVPKEGG